MTVYKGPIQSILKQYVHRIGTPEDMVELFTSFTTRVDVRNQ